MGASIRPLGPGRHAVITGGSSGLGLELAHRLAARGMHLTLVARDRANLDAAATAIEARRPGVQVRVLSIDVRDLGALTSEFATISQQRGGLDVLINSAEILREGYFETLTDADFRDVMLVNYIGTVNAIRAALPHLKASRGHIVNIASVAGLTGVFGYTPYCASKYALVGFTESVRYELEPQGVKVHLVCPGEFDSPMVELLDARRTPENRIPKLSVEQIAAETIAGLDRGHRTITPGRADQDPRDPAAALSRHRRRHRPPPDRHRLPLSPSRRRVDARWRTLAGQASSMDPGGLGALFPRFAAGRCRYQASSVAKRRGHVGTCRSRLPYLDGPGRGGSRLRWWWLFRRRPG